MEISITSKTVSQQTICGDTESLNIEITSDMECNLTQSKEKREIEKTKNKLMRARRIYFKYFPPQKMAQMKATVRKRATERIKTLPHPPKHPVKKIRIKVIKSPLPPRKGTKKVNRSRHY